MDTGTKAVITRRSISNEIRHRNKWTVISSVLGLIPTLLLGSILTVVFINKLIRSIEYSRGLFDLLASIGGMLLSLLVLSVAVAFVVAVIKAVIQLKKTYHDGFFVVNTVLISKREELVGNGRRKRLERVFYFMVNNSRYVITEWDASAYEYSDEGDEFFVVLENEGATPEFAYNKKIYEYRERG